MLLWDLWTDSYVVPFARNIVEGGVGMGYRIDYSSGMATQSVVRVCRWRKHRIVFLVITVLCLWTLLWPRARSAIREMIVPGDDKVTEQAIQGLVEDLQEGDSVAHALEVFCREIIYYDP